MTNWKAHITLSLCICVIGFIFGTQCGVNLATRDFSTRMAWDPGRTEVECEQRKGKSWCEVDHIPAFTGVRVWMKAEAVVCAQNPTNVRVHVTAGATATAGWYEICSDPPKPEPVAPKPHIKSGDAITHDPSSPAVTGDGNTVIINGERK